MALPHKASVMNTKRVSTNMARQGTLPNRSLTSRRMFISCWGGGAMRSRDDQKATTRQTNATAA